MRTANENCFKTELRFASVNHKSDTKRNNSQNKTELNKPRRTTNANTKFPKPHTLHHRKR